MPLRWWSDRAATRVPFGFIVVIGAMALLLATLTVSRADDGYDTPFARAVRAATEPYRLVVWARVDGYVQSTEAMAGVGSMYTNHDDFNPPDLAHPTVLVFDEAGRLVACGYQFAKGVAPGSEFASVPQSAWYDIPRHLHYNITVGGKA